MIDNVANSKGIKPSKYITRSTIAKSILLNATKITKAFTEPDKLLSDFNKENDNETDFSMEMENITAISENQHEAMAIASIENQ
jgi:hypothetical protein